MKNISSEYKMKDAGLQSTLETKGMVTVLAIQNVTQNRTLPKSLSEMLAQCVWSKTSTLCQATV